VIHHAQLAAPPGCERAARAFWADALGFEEIEKPSALASRGGCWFRGHGIEIHIGVEVDFHPARKAHPGLLVTDIDAWAGRLAAAGYDVTWDDGFPGMRRFYTEDPFGNRLELLQLLGGELATTDPS
jgi:catechol 2,3-dioxygenase-like lactoylglutathione lyase family enzyme